MDIAATTTTDRSSMVTKGITNPHLPRRHPVNTTMAMAIRRRHLRSHKLEEPVRPYQASKIKKEALSSNQARQEDHNLVREDQAHLNGQNTTSFLVRARCLELLCASIIEENSSHETEGHKRSRGQQRLLYQFW